MTKAEKQMEITKRILSAGGKVVHVVGDEAEVDMIMDKGQFFDGEASVVEGGAHMLCHNNSLKYYLENEGMRLCTGYAASITEKDNEYMWVNHSWCIDKEGVIHECTPIKRDKYFGVIMDEKETERFRRGIDYEYDAECRKREEQGIDSNVQEEAPKVNVVTAKPERGIKGWIKRIMSKLKSKKTLALDEAKVLETAEKHNSILEKLRDSVNESTEHDNIMAKTENTKELSDKDVVVI